AVDGRFVLLGREVEAEDLAGAIERFDVDPLRPLPLRRQGGGREPGRDGRGQRLEKTAPAGARGRVVLLVTHRGSCPENTLTSAGIEYTSMSPAPLRVLLVEDDLAYAGLIQAELQNSGIDLFT